MHTTIGRAVFALLFIIVTLLTLWPNPDSARTGIVLTRWLASTFLGDPALADKVGHFLGYAALGFAAFFARLTPRNRWYLVPLALAVYGVGLEGLQGLGGIRSPELADAVSNALGAAAGFPGAALVFAVIRR